MKTGVNPFFCPMDKKKISPHIEWCIGKCRGLRTLFFKTSTCQVLEVYALSRVFVFLGIHFFNFYAQTVLWGL